MSDYKTADLQIIFDNIDLDNKGHITTADLKNLLSHEMYTDEHLDLLLKKLDADADGKLGFEDFQKIMGCSIMRSK